MRLIPAFLLGLAAGAGAMTWFYANGGEIRVARLRIGTAAKNRSGCRSCVAFAGAACCRARYHRERLADRQSVAEWSKQRELQQDAACGSGQRAAILRRWSW
jgi:hypothetical protein